MNWKDLLRENDSHNIEEEPQFIFEGLEPALDFTFRKASDHMIRNKTNVIDVNQYDVSFQLVKSGFDSVPNSTRYFSISMTVPENQWSKILRINLSAKYGAESYSGSPICRDRIYQYDNLFSGHHSIDIMFNDLFIREEFKGITAESECMRFSSIHALEDYLSKMEKDKTHDFKYHFVKSSIQFLPEYLVEQLSNKKGMN